MWLGIIGVAMLFEKVLEKKFDKKIFFILLVIVALLSLITGYRSRIISLFIILILMYNKWKKIKINKLIFLGIAIIGLGTVLGLARSSLSDTNSYYGIFETIGIHIDGGSENIDIIFRNFPNKIPYQYGYTYLINIIMLKPGPDLDFTLWLKEKVNMTFDGGGLTPTLLGEFYINWGNIGVFLGFCLMGIIIAYIDKYYKESEKIYFASFLVWILLSSVRGGFANVEINLILFGVVYYFVYRFSIDENKKKGIKNGKNSII